ncbi:MAG: Cell division inhibitor [uncultured Thiotrichaceae bacterium]|uniref:Cell division inhibitor n=1 Tax=uncultured Thiotrichaceae bacterium TaxID=298394 RepID=A0A6S6SYM0_9GAMM|nr:MAG: Cell division inhibitor [uncultured Thiotrichaceae bacterium]
MTTTNTCLITGGSGFIGQHLIPQLLNANYQITVLTRFPEKTAKLFKKPIQCIETLEQIHDDQTFDAVINLAGQGIADARWSDANKQSIRSSRMSITTALITLFQRLNTKPGIFISGSAIGYYGAGIKTNITETSGTDNSFSSTLCMEWENIASQALDLEIRTCILRTGIVLGRNGGALKRMLPPFKFGLGGRIGNGQQWMSWIHIDDLCNMMLYMIKHNDLEGTFNGTAPTPVTNQDFTKSLAKRLHRPAIFPMPAMVVKLLFGQMGEELLLAGHQVIPNRILQTDFTFQYPTLTQALENVV